MVLIKHADQIDEGDKISIGEKAAGIEAVPFIFKSNILFLPNRITSLEDVRNMMNITLLFDSIDISKYTKVLVYNDGLGLFKASKPLISNTYYICPNKYNKDCHLKNRVDKYYDDEKDKDIEFDILVFFGDDLIEFCNMNLNNKKYKRMLFLCKSDMICEMLLHYGIFVYSEKRVYDTENMKVDYKCNQKIVGYNYSLIEFVNKNADEK